MSADDAQVLLQSIGLFSVRLGVCVSLLPLLNVSLVSRPALTSMCFFLGAYAWSADPEALTRLLEAPDGASGSSAYPLMLVYLSEAITGLIMGFFLCFPFYIPQAIGNLIDNQSGASFASQMDPISNEEVATTGNILSRATFGIFILNGGMQMVCGALLDSFQAIPIGQFWSLDGFQSLLSKATPAFTNYLRLTMTLAFPAMFAMALVDSWLGMASVMNKSLDVFFLSIPIKNLVALVVLVIAAPFIYGGIGESLETIKHVSSLLVGADR